MNLFPRSKKTTQIIEKAQEMALPDLVFTIADQSDLIELYRCAVEWLWRQTGVTLVILYPYDAALDRLANPIVVGEQTPKLPQQLRIGEGLHGDIASTRQARLLESVPTGSALVAMPGIRCVYVIPLVYAASLIGVVSLQSAQDNVFTASRCEALDTAARLIAAQALLLRRMGNSQQVIARFDRFQMLAQRLSEKLKTDNLLQTIVDAAREMLDTQMSVLCEVRPNDEHLYPVAWAGIDDETAMLLKSRLKDDLKGLVAWARKPARTANLRTDQRTARATQAVVAGMLSELAVPVMYRDTLYGTLAVETIQHREFSDEEMNLLMSLASQAGVALNNARLFETLQLTNSQLEEAVAELVKSREELALAHEAQIRTYEAELEMARQIQESLLPQEAPLLPQLQVAGRYVPARHVSGDFYLYLSLPDGKLAVAVGDVTGKGMPAALLMAVTTTTLRDQIVQTPAPDSLFNALNTRLLPRMHQNNMNSGLVMAIFDPATYQIEVANAGMVQPFMRSAQGWVYVSVGGYPLGAVQRSAYRAQGMSFPAGSVLLLVSDGVTECQNPSGELYSFERLENLLAALPAELTADQVVDNVLDAVYQFIEGQEAQDDVTVVAIKALPTR